MREKTMPKRPRSRKAGGDDDERPGTMDALLAALQRVTELAPGSGRSFDQDVAEWLDQANSLSPPDRADQRARMLRWSEALRSVIVPLASALRVLQHDVGMTIASAELCMRGSQMISRELEALAGTADEDSVREVERHRSRCERAIVAFDYQSVEERRDRCLTVMENFAHDGPSSLSSTLESGLRTVREIHAWCVPPGRAWSAEDEESAVRAETDGWARRVRHELAAIEAPFRLVEDPTRIVEALRADESGRGIRLRLAALSKECGAFGDNDRSLVNVDEAYKQARRRRRRQTSRESSSKP